MTEEDLNNSLNSWRDALKTFERIFEEEESDIVRDAAIKRFEYNFELSWKAIKRFAKRENIECVSPRSAFKAAFSLSWIENADIWLDMIDDRNITTHTYKEMTSQAIYHRLGLYYSEMKKLYNKLLQV